ncbi:glycine betaine/L-proline ABC transporter substrate-binding protein ProX [Aquamicrobium sp. LC103]|uniref:glycine betaine/L-proline ABC transporter substrate-binding protein ProX n=1 Tax=Aquamicrobium sp. LC103 TaxID=1120658 RepID=UPI00063EC069|nr:glycine betaine/L-proline ABC transporter substrate-binding protein ProX [Aquamicrobium sp. LC103]TKT78299.1 glycine betaine/L-proline ABC transporter substrate-binding protein ProX [Aquamicrobium sp. LC103]
MARSKFVFGLGLAVATMALSASPLWAQSLPGEGKTVKMGQPTWDTEWFQAQIYKKAMEALGYTVEGPTALDNPPFYQAVAQGDMDFWASGWFPLHNTYLEDIKGKASSVGFVAKGGALQGYLIDKKTAEEHNIRLIDDFKKPEVAKLFDSNGDGKADLVACPPGWGCELTITHQMEAYGLGESVNAIQAAYSVSMADAISRYEQGQPIFFYTWTPNWTVGMLKPDEDVVWLEVSQPSLPEEQKDMEAHTAIPGVKGCASDPCQMGWPANDIQVVANQQFLDENPAAKKLFEVMSIPLEDIFAQNAQMYEGADKPADLERQADEWIKANEQAFDGWIEAAKQAAN